METVSFCITPEEKAAIETHYALYREENSDAYIAFFARKDSLTVTIYSSKKGYKALFAGPDSLSEARRFHPSAALNQPKIQEKREFLTFQPQIGSDEVGFGDFFGPLVVVACYYDDALSPQIAHIRDSKKLTDEFILKYVPQLLPHVVFSKLTVHNVKYNQMIAKGCNMSELKARLHNCALSNVSERVPSCRSFFIDQFCDEDLYYAYVRFETKIVTGITFRTKGESYYPSVALASMIARYSFLKEMDALSERYGMTFPKGAGKQADDFAEIFVQKFGKQRLASVCKTNFANYKKL